MNLKAFLAENVAKIENEFYVASKRFRDENGEPMRWEVRSITSAEDEALRRSCIHRVPVPGKRNQYTQETDYNQYLGKLAVACTVFPNLNDASLQDSWGVKGGEQLLKKMLSAGEYADYLEKVQQICGFEQSAQDLEDEAKN